MSKRESEEEIDRMIKRAFTTEKLRPIDTENLIRILERKPLKKEETE
jgi:hypothetical protein